jgi:hypothetical protein
MSGAKMTRQNRIKTVLACAAMSMALTMLGCTPAEENEAITALQTGLTDLTQNRALTEQFVRDLKSQCDPNDPAYIQAMDSYDQAKDVYNRFLDDAETGVRQDGTRSLHHSSPRDVQNATANFLEDATRALKPSINTRKVAFQRAIVVPEGLEASLAKLPKKARRNITEQFDDQVRWRGWGDI